MSKKIEVLDSKKGYNLAAPKYDKNNAYLNSFEKEELWRMIGDVDNLDILDVGAGTGRVTVRLAHEGAHVTALDVSEEMLEVLIKKSHKIKTIVGDAEKLPCEDDSFDMIISTFVIVHLADPKRFFDEVYRVLRPDGVLIVTNINQKRPPEVETNNDPIIIDSYYHRPEAIIEKLEDLAFEIAEEKIVYEGDVWVNQIIKAVK